MSKYIPAMKVTDHFGRTRFDVEILGVEAMADYQQALTKATEMSLCKRKEANPIVRADGFQFKDDVIVPVVLKEVVLMEKPDDQ